MDKEQCVIIQHTGKPLTFSNGKEANMGFNSQFDTFVMALDKYKTTEIFKRYNKLSIGM